MDIGVMLPVEGEHANRAGIVDVARLCEELGFHSLWVSDRIVMPTAGPRDYPYSPLRGASAFAADRQWLEPLAVLGLAAGVTHRVQLGTSVLVLPYRNPLVIAQQIATLDVLSSGRIVLGVGPGWMGEEFSALGVPRAERAERTDETIRAMRALWRGEDTTFAGQHFQFSAVTLAAKSPRRSGIPVIIGGNSDAALSRAGRLGDGWAGIDLSPIETDSRVRTFRTICADLKRESQKMVVSMRKRVEVEGSRGAASIDKMRSEIVEYARAGVNLLIFDVLNLGNPTAAIERLAERVLDAAADV